MGAIKLVSQLVLAFVGLLAVSGFLATLLYGVWLIMGVA